jgi:hypothetical protein
MRITSRLGSVSCVKVQRSGFQTKPRRFRAPIGRAVSTAHNRPIEPAMQTPRVNACGNWGVTESSRRRESVTVLGKQPTTHPRRHPRHQTATESKPYNERPEGQFI